MNRYWRRKQYQRLATTTNRKRKLNIVKLGSQTQVYDTPKVMFKFISPVKLFSKFRNGVIVRLSSNEKKLLENRTDCSQKRRTMPMVVGANNEVVDAKMVLEIYKRLVSSSEVSRLLV